MITIMLNGPGPCTVSSFSIRDKNDVEVNMCCVSFTVKAKTLNKKNTQQYFRNNEILNHEAQVVLLSL